MTTAYAETDYADAYFDESFWGDIWTAATTPKKEKALKEATRRIDVLRFVGKKTVSTQENQFPRNGDTEVPDEIKRACCELAKRFIEGIDPEYEMDGARIVSSGVSSARMTQDTDMTPEWIINGIPSQAAWVLLLPFINDNLTLRVK